MSEIVKEIIINIITATAVGLLGIGAYKVVVVHKHERTHRGGKKTMIVGFLMIIGGLFWASQSNTSGVGINFSEPKTIYGLTLAGYGLIIFVIGKVVAWYQR